MNPSFARPEVLALVRRCVAESLALDPEKIAPESRLIDDLGADSLDFADIVFALGHELELPLRETEFNFLTHLDFTSPDVMQNGQLTHDVVARLATWLPALAARPDKTGVTPAELFSLISVEAICIVACRQLTALGR